MRYQLRPYQQEAVNRLRDSYRNHNKRVVLVSPTGSGKTVIASDIIERATIKNGGRVLFIAHRREIIDQTSQKLTEIDVPHGIMMGDDGRKDPSAPVQLASIQTLIRRELPPVDFIIIDECHLSLAISYQKIMCHYEDTPILGLTATPWRTDGQGLGRIYEDMVMVSQVKELIREGYLLAPEIFAPFRPDLSKVRVRAGDYIESDLSAVMDKNHLIGSIVSHWTTYARNMTTVVFASSRQHSKHIVHNFLNAGIAAEHLDHTTPKDKRNDILQRLAIGKLMVVSNVGILTEGWDLPQLECIIMARPTMSETLYLQMVGRVMRTIKGKTRALMMDHAGCFFKHNSPIIDRNYSLNDKVQKRNSKKLGKKLIKICPNCYRVCASHNVICPMCKYEFNSGVVPEETSGQLIKIREEHVPSCKNCGKQTLQRARRGYISENAIEYRCTACKMPNILATNKLRDLTQTQRYEEFRKLKTYGIIKGYDQKWAKIRYRNLFGIDPEQDINMFSTIETSVQPSK